MPKSPNEPPASSQPSRTASTSCSRTTGAYGLPLPPEDAKLVRFESGGRYILNDKLMPPTYFLGFLLRPGTKESPPLLLVGTQEIRLDAHPTVEVVEPKSELVKSIDLRWWGADIRA